MADTNTNELKIVFTIADLASSKINEINGKWDSMRQLIGEDKKYSEQFKKSVQEVDSSFMSMKRGFAILNQRASIAKTYKDLYDDRTESLKLEKNLQSLGLSAFQLSEKIGISVETILSGVNKIKSSFKSLNSSDLNALVGIVANTVLATGEKFSDLTEQLIFTGKQVKNFNADINQLDFSNITDFQLSSEKMDSFPFQLNRASESWNNFKKILGKGIEDFALVKFGIIESVLKNIFELLANGIGKINVFLGKNSKLAEFAGTFFMLGGGILFGAGALIILKSVALGLFTALKVAVMSNPIVLAVAGIVADLVLITYWDDIKITAIKTWNWIVNTWSNLSGFGKIVNSIFSIFSNRIQEILFFTMVDPIFGLYSLIWQALGNVVGDIRNRMKDSGKSLFTAFSEGIQYSIADLKSTIHDIMQSIDRYLPHSNALEGLLSRITDSGFAFINTFILGMKQKSNTLVGEMFNGFKSGLNFIQESGAKSTTIFSEEIPSNKLVVYNKLMYLLEKTRRLFLNSDVKEGPFSTLTKSDRATIAVFSSGLELEIPKTNPILQRFHQVLTNDSKGIIKRTLESKENSEVISEKSNVTSNTNIGSVIGQLVIGNKTMDKKKIGEMIADAIFQELDRFEEMELI
ncbi:hypothetical protein L9Z41_00945 [Leptospira noguchii]|uniref:hypothetical protein n=1 Tax=Leptospira noguchii TaxID=28182 RepID=UPI001F067B98|nr:hypothetical protein [Leptospira noguchii]MCH1911223.1 hypothetical protein [Leptospira noguchii]MCH1914255.1 hypothetical protein [Leptospira noguchii]UOG64239.1 hypothetical protein MAL04_00960 [Leptospira noguchii]